jgi:hypothetical protein
MRNALAHAPAKQRTAVAAMLKTIFAQESKADAEDQWDTVAFTGLTRPHCGVSDGYAPLILPCGRWCVQFLADLNVYVLTGESRTCSL